VMSCKSRYFGAGILVLTLILFVFVVAGCISVSWPKIKWPKITWQQPDEPERQTGIQQFEVIPISNRDVADLDSDDIVNIMRRAGFSDEQILVLGPDLRNAILLMGAAQIRREKIEAIFAVRGEYIFITTRLRGNFIYNPKSKQFGMGAAAPSEPSLSPSTSPSAADFQRLNRGF
jgi:hypothetical protein